MSAQPGSPPTPGWQQDAALAFDGANYLVAWTHGGYPDADVYGTRASRDGNVLDPAGIAISTELRVQGFPALAFDGVNYLVAWIDSRSDDSYYDVYATRVSPSGTVLDPGGIPISAAPGSQGPVAVAFDGTNYLLVWADTRSFGGADVYGARLTPTGTVLDPDGIAIADAAARAPAVAFDGTNYLVAWADERAPSQYDLYGARVTTAGTVLDPDGIAISTAPDFQWEPRLAFDGTNYFVVWQDRRRVNGDWDIYGARVSPSGSVLDPSGIVISEATRIQESPALAFDGTNYLVAWEDERSGLNDIYAARVTPGGSVLDTAGITVSAAYEDQEAPALAFDGLNYLVAWTDSRTGDFMYDIYGARVSPAGSLLDPNGILLSTTPPPPMPPPPPPPPPPPAPPVPPPPPPPQPPRPGRRCIVPRVVGLRLARATRKIGRAHCSVGSVRRRRSARAGIVLAQRPRARAIRRRGWPVSLVVGRR